MPTSPTPSDAENDGPPGLEADVSRKVINQGEIYWVTLAAQDGAEAGISHPHVVVQEDIFNHSRVDTVIVCALTSNRKRVNLPGNVLLEAGEANLPRQSVVEVSKLASVKKTQLGAYIGSLDAARIQQILAGIQFVQALTGPGQGGGGNKGE